MKAIALTLFIAVPSFAQVPAEEVPPPTTIFAVGGDVSWGIGINGQAVGWVLPRAHSHVTIAARIGNGGGHAYVDAYLTHKIGPEATEADEVAHSSFDLNYPSDGWVPLFSDIDLDKGVYWLILARPRERAHSSINWFVARPMVIHTDCGEARYLGSRSYTFFGDAAEYIPASKFEKKFEPYGFQFAITEPRDPQLPPCTQ